ncbi:hypothetical protein E2C01_050293 [Portunus trituberculatus]|uniref:Uncharacterized protein n=1 Tax=Portunus trituberculatus TaxID=210409 RepID=A0A5B7GG17_PORTR|nr:hypothetical protein [Portunus trituberculatus]
MESLVRWAYPAAQEDMARDYFVDALQDSCLQIYVKQTRPKDVQEALTRGSEIEAFLRTTIPRNKLPVDSSTYFRACGWHGEWGLCSVVDTGFEKTFVGEDLVDVSSVSEATQKLCGVTVQCVTVW